MKDYREKNELLEEEDLEGKEIASYEEIMAVKKLTIEDIKEHFTGPVVSVLLHVVAKVIS